MCTLRPQLNSGKPRTDSIAETGFCDQVRYHGDFGKTQMLLLLQNEPFLRIATVDLEDRTYHLERFGWCGTGGWRSVVEKIH